LIINTLKTPLSLKFKEIIPISFGNHRITTDELISARFKRV